MLLPFLAWEAYQMIETAVANGAVKLLLMFYPVCNPEWFVFEDLSPVFIRIVVPDLFRYLIR